jgi:hypothetical protein
MKFIFVLNNFNFLNYFLRAFSVPIKFVGHNFKDSNLGHIRATFVEVHAKYIKVVRSFFFQNVGF